MAARLGLGDPALLARAVSGSCGDCAAPITLLRLRLRRSLSRGVRMDEPFALCVDAIDEMARPPSLPLIRAALQRETLRVHAVTDSGGAVDSACPWELIYDSSVETETHRTTHVQWRIRCCLRRRPSQAIGACTHPIRLQIALDPTISTQAKAAASSISSSSSSPSALSSASTSITIALQSFCVGSAWLDKTKTTLVLPVVSSELAVLLTEGGPQLPRRKEAGGGQSTLPPSPSSRCLRVFALSPTDRIVIEEDHGLAMGAHVWDASIWLSLALLQLIKPTPSASSSPSPNACSLGPRDSAGRMLELGAGCGLVGIVYAKLHAQLATPRASPPSNDDAPPAIILTERADGMEMLRANIARNDVGDRVSGLELAWGDDIDDGSADLKALDVVLAADVLYHWSSHESLLTTLESIVIRRECAVVIAHRHRGGRATSTQRLEGVLAVGVDQHCGDRCRWRLWEVTRLVRLGEVEMFRLQRRSVLDGQGCDR